MQSHHGSWVLYLYHDKPAGIPEANPATFVLYPQMDVDVTLLLATRYLTGRYSSLPSWYPAYVFAAIGVTCFLWDYFLSIDQEVKYIWSQKRWNFSHHAFVWKRYTSLVGLIYGAFRAYLPPLIPSRAHYESQSPAVCNRQSVTR